MSAAGSDCGAASKRSSLRREPHRPGREKPRGRTSPPAVPRRGLRAANIRTAPRRQPARSRQRWSGVSAARTAARPSRSPGGSTCTSSSTIWCCPGGARPAGGSGSCGRQAWPSARERGAGSRKLTGAARIAAFCQGVLAGNQEGCSCLTIRFFRGRLTCAQSAAEDPAFPSGMTRTTAPAVTSGWSRCAGLRSASSARAGRSSRRRRQGRSDRGRGRTDAEKRPTGISRGPLFCFPVPVRGVGCVRKSPVLPWLQLSMSCRPREGCGLRPALSCRRESSLRGCRPREGCGLRLLLAQVAKQLPGGVAVPVRGAGCVSKTAQPKGIKLDAFHSP